MAPVPLINHPISAMTHPHTNACICGKRTLEFEPITNPIPSSPHWLPGSCPIIACLPLNLTRTRTRLDRSLRLGLRLLLSPTSEPAEPTPPCGRRSLSRHRNGLAIDHPRARFVLAVEGGVSLGDPRSDTDGTAGNRDALGRQVFLTPDG